MRRSARLFLIAAVVGLSGLLAGSVASGSQATIDRPDSERFSFFGGAPEQFQAGEPFHISHGWAVNKELGVPKNEYSFHLFVDGHQEPPDFIGCIDEPAPAGSTECRAFLYDFPDGLSEGTHEFVGVWIAPCGAFLPPWQSCVDPKAPMAHPDLVRSFTVEFVAAE